MAVVVVKVFRTRVALNLPRRDASLLAFAFLVVQKMTNNVNFPNPGTLLTELEDAAGAYERAIGDIGRLKNATDARTAARQLVVDLLAHVKDYVNGVVETLPPDEAKAAITSAGLHSKKRSTRIKPDLEIKYGGLAGSVRIVARAVAKGAMYFFEYSTNQTDWVACPSVMRADTSVSGLTVGTTYSFRFRAQARKGMGDYSIVVSFTVR